MASDLDVVEHAHAPEEGDVLEGAGDPQPGALVGRQVRNVVSVEGDAPARGRVDPADAVEDAGLARAVRADDREEVAGGNVHADAGQGRHAAEVEMQPLEGEQRHARLRAAALRRGARTRAPRGLDDRRERRKVVREPDPGHDSLEGWTVGYSTSGGTLR